MKAILEFNLPEERNEFDCCINGSDYQSALAHIDDFLRNALKHGHNFKTPEEVMEWTRNRIAEEEVW